MLQGLESLKQNNLSMLEQMEKQINEEEASDTQLRTQFGTKWNRLPSSSLNGQFKHTIQDYKSKLEMAKSTDQQIEQKFKDNQENFQLLSKTKNELAQMIPQVEGAQEAASQPPVVAI